MEHINLWSDRELHLEVDVQLAAQTPVHVADEVPDEDLGVHVAAAGDVFQESVDLVVDIVHRSETDDVSVFLLPDFRRQVCDGAIDELSLVVHAVLVGPYFTFVLQVGRVHVHSSVATSCYFSYSHGVHSLATS